MKNLVIENKGDQVILKINRKGFDENYLISLLKRLQIEQLAQKSEFSDDIINVAEQVNEEWWDENGKDFLKEVKQ
ncbi:MAG TPA: hypothetical protein VFC92_02355 [Bacteroidales bacterium]|nr:hypothetical protein [Bacteroidales bacterium]